MIIVRRNGDNCERYGIRESQQQCDPLIKPGEKELLQGERL